MRLEEFFDLREAAPTDPEVKRLVDRAVDEIMELMDDVGYRENVEKIVARLIADCPAAEKKYAPKLRKGGFFDDPKRR
jgi:hypothetical protein